MTTSIPSVNYTSATGAITSAGVGSGIDMESLITKLVSADSAPTQTRISNQQTQVNAQLSAVGTVQSLLSNVQSKLDALTSSTGTLAGLAANSSNTSVFTASATTGAAAGSYSIEVDSLAKADKQVSSAISGDSSTVLGAGTFSVSVGGKSLTVTLGSTDNTLGNLRDAINSASNNPGVTATLITESGGTHLVLSSNQTGVANAMTISSSLMSFSQTQTPQDAHLKVEGYDVYSSTNSVSNAVDGVTINLQSADVGTTNTLTVTPDSTGITSGIQSFVSAYNTAMTTLRSLTAYDASTNTAGALNGDSLINGAIRQLRSIVGSTVTGAGSFNNLSQLGITADETGQLTLDTGVLSSALSSDSASVQKLFDASNGYGSQLDSMLNGLVGTSGSLTSRKTSLQSQLTTLGKEQDDLNTRMSADEASYRKQYTALDSLIASMNSTSSFLTTQLTMLQNMTTGTSGK